MTTLSRIGAFTLLALSSTTIMVGCVIVPGLAEIAQNTGVAQYAGWLVTIPALGVALFGPLAARLIQGAGARRALCLGLFAYGALGMGGQLLQGVVPVLTLRLLLGAATAIIMAAGTGLISEFYQGAERLKMIARQGMAIELGGVIFLFIGGLLATMGWRWPFLLYGIGWVFMAMVLLFVPVPAKASELDDTTVPPVVLAPTLKFVYSAALVSMVLFFVAIIKLPAKMGALGIGAAGTGYFLAFVSLIAVVAAGTLPQVVARRGESGTLMLAFLAYGCAHAVFAAGSNLGQLVLGGIAAGIGFGLSIPLVNSMTVDHSSVSARPRALSYLSMAIFSGQFLSAFAEIIPGTTSVIFALASAIGMLGGLIIFGQRHRFVAEPNRPVM
jgi:MFS family permease